MKVKLRTLKKGEMTPKLKYELLQNDPETRQKYAITDNGEEQHARYRTCRRIKMEHSENNTCNINKEVIPKRERQKWMINEILYLMKKTIYLQYEEIEKCEKSEKGEKSGHLD